MVSTNIAMPTNVNTLIDEYAQKRDNLTISIKALESAVAAFKMNTSVQGAYGGGSGKLGYVPHISDIQNSLKISAWRALYKLYNLENLLTPSEIKRFEDSLNREPPEFDKETIIATFGEKMVNPRKAILASLAEIFCDLDPFYKSHDNFGIGVKKGLPKRIILRNATYFPYQASSSLCTKVLSIMNSIRLVQGVGPCTYQDIMWTIEGKGEHETYKVVPGFSIKLFANGNAHMFFEPDENRAIAEGLAEYYGNVLPDASEPEEPIKKKKSTSVAKDLQFYRTPKAAANLVAQQVSEYLHRFDNPIILEPSCGDGALMDAIANLGKNIKLHGVEVDADRAVMSRVKGYNVITTNFLEMVPPATKYDMVVMNPPFYGKHYQQHVRHALTFVQTDGVVIAILPITAKYEHKFADDLKKEGYRVDTRELPMGSFAESGTNIITVMFTIQPR